MRLETPHFCQYSIRRSAKASLQDLSCNIPMHMVGAKVRTDAIARFEITDRSTNGEHFTRAIGTRDDIGFLPVYTVQPGWMGCIVELTYPRPYVPVTIARSRY